MANCYPVDRLLTPRPGTLLSGEQFRVRKISSEDRVAVLAGSDGEEFECPVSDLLVVKRFGEPMYAALKPLEQLARGDEKKPHHAVIDGENFHALQLFSYVYASAVDCIYIDPPYNTGARDWKYNNRYVDNNDSWRHSKWLAMMDKRLRLAKRLLKPDGVLVVMIDEHELHHLGMLLERIFPDYLQHVVSIVINARGSTGNRNFGSIEEQALFVVPNLGVDVIQPRESFIPGFHSTTEGAGTAEGLLIKIAQLFPKVGEDERLALDEDEVSEWQDATTAATQGTLIDEDDVLDEELEPPEGEVPVEIDPAVYWRGAVRTGQGTSFRSQRRNQFYPLYIDSSDPNRDIVVGEALLETTRENSLAAPSWDEVDGLVPIWPIDEEAAERVWCYRPERMREEIAKGNIRIGRFNPKRNTYAVNVRRTRRTAQRFRERTIWWEKAYDAGSNGTNILKNLLGASGLFPFPKSVYAVRDVLATVVGTRPNALIVDFFAGSGTTLHATSLLNAIDNGKRRCVLVTNNEVDEQTTRNLAAAGHHRGDKEFEAAGIYERVTAPRVKAAISGTRADGTPLSGKYKWAGKRLLGDGFPENVEFYRLEYLDPESVDLGEQFNKIHPLLWLAAGGLGTREDEPTLGDFYLAPYSPYAVLFKPARLLRFLKALALRPEITHIWIVTDSEQAFAEACQQLPPTISYTSQLYRDYLRTFKVNGRNQP